MIFPALVISYPMALFAAPPNTASPSPTPSPFDGDERLNRKITIFQPAIALKDAITLLSDTLQVPLKARTKDPILDRNICLLVKDAPAKDALAALASLFAYKHLSCRWEAVEKENGEKEYQFRYSGDFRTSAAELRAEARTAFRRELEAARKFSQTSAKKPSPKESDSSPRYFFETRGNDEVFRLGLRAFFQGVPVSIQNDVLAGSPFSIQYSAMNTTTRDLIESAPSASEAKEVRFAVTESPYTFYPTLTISIGNYHGELLGGQWAEARWKEGIREQWITRSDERTSKQESKPVPDASKPDSKNESNNASETEKTGETESEAFSRYLTKLHRTSDISMIMLLPPPPTPSRFMIVARATERPFANRPLQAVLEDYKQYPFEIDHKWHDNFLLLRNAAEPFYDVLMEDVPQPSLPESN